METQQCPGCGRFINDGEILVNLGGQHMCMSCVQHFSHAVARQAATAPQNEVVQLTSVDSESPETPAFAADEPADAIDGWASPPAPQQQHSRPRKTIRRRPKPSGFRRLVFYGVAHLVLVGVLFSLWLNGTFARWAHRDAQEVAPTLDREQVEEQQINALVVEANQVNAPAEKIKKLELAVGIAERSASAAIRGRAQRLTTAVGEIRKSLPAPPAPRIAARTPPLLLPPAPAAAPLPMPPIVPTPPVAPTPAIAPVPAVAPAPFGPATPREAKRPRLDAGGRNQAASGVQRSVARAELFGDGRHAQSVAFVCDASGSMIPKFGLLHRELRRAIDGLLPIQQFSVVFYADTKAIALEKGILIDATDENKRKAAKWLGEIYPSGRTDPIPSLDIALRGQPEVLYLLTDGEFDNSDDVMKRVIALNKGKRTRVNTIAFVDKDADRATDTFINFLTGLAAQNGGTFKRVSTSELPKVQ
jgi:hypothetical protein